MKKRILSIVFVLCILSAFMLSMNMGSFVASAVVPLSISFEITRPTVAGVFSVMGIRTDGSVWVQESSALNSPSPTPIQIGNFTDAIEVRGTSAISAPGVESFHILRANGDLYRSVSMNHIPAPRTLERVATNAIGFAIYNLMTPPVVIDSANNLRVEGNIIMDNVADITANETHLFALRTDGSVWLFEVDTNFNDRFQLIQPRNILSNIVQIDSARLLYALDINGLLLSYDPRSGTQTQVDTDVASFSSGGFGVLVRKTNGNLYRRDTMLDVPADIAYFASAFGNMQVNEFATLLRPDGSVWTIDWWGTSGVSNEPLMTNIKMPATRPGGSIIPTEMPATPEPPPIERPIQTALPSSHSVRIDGQPVAFRAFNIEGSNYFMLRDVAFALNGTARQFEVDWDGILNAIILTTSSPYTAVGGEMATGGDVATEALPSTSSIIINDRFVNLRAYNIGGNNFFMLRDLGTALGFGVDWDAATSTVLISTN
jgi:hypothetical protein